MLFDIVPCQSSSHLPCRRRFALLTHWCLSSVLWVFRRLPRLFLQLLSRLALCLFAVRCLRILTRLPCLLLWTPGEPVAFFSIFDWVLNVILWNRVLSFFTDEQRMRKSRSVCVKKSAPGGRRQLPRIKKKRIAPQLRLSGRQIRSQGPSQWSHRRKRSPLACKSTRAEGCSLRGSTQVLRLNVQRELGRKTDQPLKPSRWSQHRSTPSRLRTKW